MASGSAYYRGGPKDGQILLASDDDPDGYMWFRRDGSPFMDGSRYQLTSDTEVRNGTSYPVFDFIDFLD